MDGRIVYDSGAADWARRELDQMIDIAAGEIAASQRFAERVQHADLGQTMAGQAMRRKMMHRAGAQDGGAVWLWQRYHDTLVDYRDALGAMARVTEETDQRVREDQRGLGGE